MTWFLLLTLAVLGLLLLVAAIAVLVLWVRIVHARRRATSSVLAEAAATIRDRNNALAATDRNLPAPPPTDDSDYSLHT